MSVDITESTLTAAGKRLLYAGDDYDYTFTAACAGSPLVLTGGKVWFSIKTSLDLYDSASLWTHDSTDATRVEITDGANGIVVVHFLAADTVGIDGLWYYDVKVKLASGTVTHITDGRIQFLSPATRAYE